MSSMLSKYYTTIEMLLYCHLMMSTELDLLATLSATAASRSWRILVHTVATSRHRSWTHQSIPARESKVGRGSRKRATICSK